MLYSTSRSTSTSTSTPVISTSYHQLPATSVSSTGIKYIFLKNGFGSAKT